MNNYKKFFSLSLSIALPIALQNLLTSSVNLIDTLMIGRLGELPIAAVGLSNQLFFLLNLFVFGIASGGGIFIAQFYGKGDIKNLKKSCVLSLVPSVVIGLILGIFVVFFPKSAMKIFYQ